MRTAHEPNAANTAALKKHVVRAINNLVSKDVDGGAGHDAQACYERTEGGASTFSR